MQYMMVGMLTKLNNVGLLCLLNYCNIKTFVFKGSGSNKVVAPTE
jgi:putative flippase GtrA